MFKKAGRPVQKMSPNGRRPASSSSSSSSSVASHNAFWKRLECGQDDESNASRQQEHDGPQTQPYQSPTAAGDDIELSSSHDDSSDDSESTPDNTTGSDSCESSSSEEEEEQVQKEDDRRKGERRREPDSVVDQSDRVSKKAKSMLNELTNALQQQMTERQKMMDDYGPMNFKLPGETTIALRQEEEQHFLPHCQRMVTSEFHIVTTSSKSEAMSRYVDECTDTHHRMQIGALHRLCDIVEEMDYPLVKQRGPYGDGLVLHGVVLKVERMITNEDDRVVHVVLVDYRTDHKYLLDDRFFDDWSFVRNVDLDRMRGPAKKQFFV